MSKHRLTVTYGEEKYCPVQFQSFTVGPFSMTIEIDEGEDPVGAYRAAYALLTEIAKETRERKTEEYAANLREVLGKFKGPR